jgi:hypothetical protein
MSIDNETLVPAGARYTYKDGCGKSWATYKSDRQMPDNLKTPHQVFLAHENVDEQYFFEDPDDARWFWIQGYTGSLFVDDDGTVKPYSRMALWIDDEEVATRGCEGSDKPLFQSAEEPAATSRDLVREEEDGTRDLE